MVEPKDQGIKLFGRTIPLPEVTPSVGAASFVDDRIDQDPTCSTNSSRESDKSRDGEERDSEKVLNWIHKFWILKLTHYFNGQNI